jgi:hypothetical protein
VTHILLIPSEWLRKLQQEQLPNGVQSSTMAWMRSSSLHQADSSDDGEGNKRTGHANGFPISRPLLESF